jgi:hypothetical protein
MEEAGDGTGVCCSAHPKRNKAIDPKSKRFIRGLLDGMIVRKLPYEKLTER